MNKSFSKLLVVIAMLVAFAGQVWANSFMPCEMPVDINSSHMAMMHDSMSSNQQSQMSSQSIECCDTECHCLTNACSNVFYLNTEVKAAAIASTAEPVLTRLSEQPVTISSSLYRPPIMA